MDYDKITRVAYGLFKLIHDEPEMARSKATKKEIYEAGKSLLYSMYKVGSNPGHKYIYDTLTVDISLLAEEYAVERGLVGFEIDSNTNTRLCCWLEIVAIAIASRSLVRLADAVGYSGEDQ